MTVNLETKNIISQCVQCAKYIENTSFGLNKNYLKKNETNSLIKNLDIYKYAESLKNDKDTILPNNNTFQVFLNDLSFLSGEINLFTHDTLKSHVTINSYDSILGELTNAKYQLMYELLVQCQIKKPMKMLLEDSIKTEEDKKLFAMYQC